MKLTDFYKRDNYKNKEGYLSIVLYQALVSASHFG
jgi:hypothetical protein